MVLTIINIFLYILKLLVFSWFSSDQLFFKTILLIVLILLWYLLQKYPRPFEENINVITEHYKIKSKYDLYVSILLLNVYIIIFFLTILVLRYINASNVVDLKKIFNHIYINFVNHSILTNIINILLVIVVLLVYITLIKKILVFFKHHWVKIHIYYAIYDPSWYTRYIKDTFWSKCDISTLVDFILTKIIILKEIKLLNMHMKYHLTIFMKNIHYIVVIVVLLYDILLNNWVLQYIFIILPYIFIYDVYIRLCNLYYNIDIMNSADFILHDFIYAEEADILIISKKEVWIRGQPFETDTIAKCVFFYLKYQLNANILYQIMNKDYYDKHVLTFNYYKDRKHFKR